MMGDAAVLVGGDDADGDCAGRMGDGGGVALIGGAVECDAYEGELAADLLIDTIENAGVLPQRVFLPYELIPGSTA